MKRIVSLIVLALFSQSLWAQYTVNGNALRISCNEYRLTDSANTQSGSVWNNNKINLTQSFDFNFDVFLGYNDGGADGIAFVMQPISTSVGSSGGGMGYEGITPAVGVTIDTYQNGANADPLYDHIAYQLNGDISHNTSNNIAGPVTVINGNDNIEDGLWHSLHIVWDAPTKTLTTYVDGSLRLTAVKDLVTDVFSGNPLVFWGFTGATGGLNNLQKFKTALNPSFHFSPTQKRCEQEYIYFYDSTVSFAPIVKFYWDFGDGSNIDSVNLNPIHRYAVAGDYTVTQRVIGADGCEATNTQIIRIGSIPVANFLPNPLYCRLNNIGLFDQSHVVVGTINSWLWDLDDGLTSTLQNPVVNYPAIGFKQIRLTVKTLEGCESLPYSRSIRVGSSPIVDFTFTDSVCLGQPTYFFGSAIPTAGDTILGVNWLIDGTIFIQNTLNPVHSFNSPGNHFVSFRGISNFICFGIQGKTVFVADKPRAAVKAPVVVCQFMPIVLMDSSYTTDNIAISSYWWDLGNGQFSTQQNPVVTYNINGSVTIKHVVTNARSCVSDTIYKTLFIKPSPHVSFSFSDGCKNDVISFSAVDSSAIATTWKWTFGDGGISNSRDTQHVYSAAGTYPVTLFASAANGCFSDSLQRNIIIYSTKAFAGNDTITPSGRPLQLQASGGISYQWTPTTGLNNPFIPNPIAVLTGTQIYTYLLRAYTPLGCESFDTIKIQVYQAPEIYLPNAFTPNGDGTHDTYRGLPVGIKEFRFLKIFNRFGQEVFYSTDVMKGWDGTWKGKPQGNGVFVVIASGVDYRGIVVDRQGTVMLIR